MLYTCRSYEDSNVDYVIEVTEIDPDDNQVLGQIDPTNYSADIIRIEKEGEEREGKKEDVNKIRKEVQLILSVSALIVLLSTMAANSAITYQNVFAAKPRGAFSPPEVVITVAIDENSTPKILPFS
jgi:hypothetical protein